MSNQVYANMMEVSCKAAAGKSICAFPDVCFTPPQTPATPPGVPIPYPNTGMASDTTSGSTSVKISGKEVMLKNKSHFSKSMGDEAGCAPKKGVLTSKNTGKVYFTKWSMDVKVEGENVVRMLDLTTHNHGSVPGNTPPFPYIDEVAPAAPAAPDKVKKGDLTVKVMGVHDDKAVEKAKVVVNEIEKSTDASGSAPYSGLPAGSHAIEVEKHFSDADYVTFVVHYPRILLSHEARSSGSAIADVPDGGSATAEVKLVVYRLVPEMFFRRCHLNLRSGDYGHWWSQTDANTSFGWWPKYPMGDDRHRSGPPPEPPDPPAPGAGPLARIGHMFAVAVHAVHSKMDSLRNSGLARTFIGVEGELNGAVFSGKSIARGDSVTQDPHHDDDEFEEEYQAVVADGRSDAEIRDPMETFAYAYSGSWSWRLEFGNHCHTFQKRLMAAGDIDKVKKLK
jgi:hypothetical protein